MSIKKTWASWATILSVGVVLSLAVISNCVNFSMKAEEVDQFFQNSGQNPRFLNYQVLERNMFYVAVGEERRPLVLFVHGSPGSWDAFIRFMGNSQLLERAQVISVDRPGFGKSGFGIHEPSLARQAAMIKPILEKHRGHGPAILVGHSLGGPLVARLAMDYPEWVDGLVLVAPSIDPALEKTKWYQIPANWKLLSWMVPKVLRVTNREILPLKAELEKMLPLWETITVPVTVIQGGKDRLVPPANADFAKKYLTRAPLTMVLKPKLNHFIPWSRPDLIQNAVLEQLRVLSQTPRDSTGTY